MKTKNTFKLVAIAIFAFTAFAFTTLTSKNVDIKESKVTWKAYKVTGSSHEGTINLKKGTLNFEGDKIVGGEFMVDMTSISTTDLSGDSKKSLDGHLKSKDFFGVDKHPTATFKITGIRGAKNQYKVNGDLTIKGITSPVSFIMNVKDNTASAKLKVDRTKFDIKYGSASFFDGLKDKAINDEFDLNVSLKF